MIRNSYKNVVIFTEDDLIQHSKHTPFWMVEMKDVDHFSTFSIKQTSLIDKANVVIFKDGYNIKVLKSKYYNPDLCNNYKHNLKEQVRLNNGNIPRATAITGSQQKMLSDVLDSIDSYTLTSAIVSAMVMALQRCWYDNQSLDKDYLNLVRDVYLENS